MKIEDTIECIELKHLLDSLLELEIGLDSHAIEIWTEKNSRAFYKLASKILNTSKLNFFLKDISTLGEESRKIIEHSIDGSSKKYGESTAFSVIDCADGKKIPVKTGIRKAVEKHCFFEWIRFVLNHALEADNGKDKNNLYFDKDDELPEVFYTPFIDLMKKLAGIEES